MKILGLFRKNSRREAIETLYQRIAAASRDPFLYLDQGVPDTVEGRFEALTLHVTLVLRRLRQLPSPADEVAQELVDAFFRQPRRLAPGTGCGRAETDARPGRGFHRALESLR